MNTTTPPLFERPALIGMVHLRALPGSPRGQLPIDQIVDTAAREASLLAETGFDALILENMHDRPYIHGRHRPHTVAIMTRAALAVRQAGVRAGIALPLGIQVLSGGNREALAIAAAAAPGPLLRYRREIGADHVRILADIKKKHASHALTADVTLADAVEAAEFFGADGVIVTGAATGKAARLEDVEAARRATTLPVLVGSGVTPDAVGVLVRQANALIVGSWIKRDGLWSNELDPDRCRRMAEAFRSVAG